MAVPNIFATKTGTILLSELDTNFATPIVIGTTSIALGSAETVIEGITLVAPALGTPSVLVGTNITGTASAFTASNVTTNANLTGAVTSVGNATTVVTNANLTGDVTSVGNATTLTNAPVIAKVLTGYVSGAGAVAATDSILQAIQKLNGNDATNANLSGAVTSVGNTTSLGSFTSANLATALTDKTGSDANVFATSPTLVSPALGTPTSGTLTNCTLPQLSASTGSTLVGTTNGGTGAVTRTVASKLNDIVSVKDFGAVGNNTTDDTTAFINAIATGKAIYVPTGTYYVTNILTLQNGQTMWGDGRTKSVISVKATFNLAALGVIRLGTGEPGSTLLDIGISFYQDSTVSLRANVIQYPPAIYAVACPRFQIDRVRISAAWLGLDATGNSGGAYIGRLEVGALSKGVMFDGALDFVHINTIEAWPYGLSSGNIYTSVYKDGLTIGFECGECDGLSISKLGGFNNKVLFKSGAASSLPRNISTLQLDGDLSAYLNESQDVQIGNCYSTKGSVSTVSSIENSGGKTIISNFHSIGNSIAPDVLCTGGLLKITGGYSNIVGLNKQGFKVTGGVLYVQNVRMDLQAAVRTTPYIEQTNGALVVNDCDFNTAGAGPAITVAVDNGSNRIQNNNFNNWGFVLPTGAYLGCYGSNKVKAIAYTPTVSFGTNGDFTPTYTLRNGAMWYTGTGVNFEQRIIFSCNSYTTASGAFLISGPPVLEYAGADYPSNTVVNLYSKLTLDALCTGVGVLKLITDDNFTLVQMRAGTTSLILTTANLPAGTTNIELTMGGSIQTL